MNAAVPALRAAKARFDAAQTEVDRVMAAKPARPDLSAVETALEDARRDFEDASAARALGTAGDDEVRQAADALTKARAAHEAATQQDEAFDMTLSGFERALEGVRAEVDASAAERKAAEVEWLRAELVVADQAYCAAAETMLAHWRAAKALARAIKARTGRSNNHTELAQAPQIPALGAWRDPETHGREIFRAQAVDWSAAENALQAASISGKA